MNVRWQALSGVLRRHRVIKKLRSERVPRDTLRGHVPLPLPPPDDPAYRRRDNCVRRPSPAFTRTGNCVCKTKRTRPDQFTPITVKEARQNAAELTAPFRGEKQMTQAGLELARLRGWGQKFASYLAGIRMGLESKKSGSPAQEARTGSRTGTLSRPSCRLSEQL